MSNPPTVAIQQFIVVESTTGRGTAHDPARRVWHLYTMTGRLIGELDHPYAYREADAETMHDRDEGRDA